MVYLILNWILSSFSLFALAVVFPGFKVLDLEAAALTAGTVGLISASLGMLLRYTTGPVVLMSAAFLFVVDTFLVRVSALLVPGFAMRGFLPAIAGAVVLLALNVLLLRVKRTARLDSGSLLSS